MQAMKVLAVLTQWWVEDGIESCRARKGHHPVGCRHRANVVPYTLRALATAVFGQGHDGGRQTGFVQRALDELASETTTVFWDGLGGRRYFKQVSHILSYRETGRHQSGGRAPQRDVHATGEVRWDPFVHESLLLGHFQLLPGALVRYLRGSALLLWVQVLAQPATARHPSVAFSVTGYNPTLPPTRLGLQKARPDRLRRALEQGAAAGNALQAEFRLSVEERSSSGGGLKVRLDRLRGTDPRQPRDDMSTFRDGNLRFRGGVLTGHRSRTPRPFTPDETRPFAPLDASLWAGAEHDLDVILETE
jgi:hypothetical protein